MGDVVVGSGEIDCWREVVPVQHEDRQLTVQIFFRTLKYSAAVKEYHIKLTSEEDDCFLYRTVITPEEHRKLMLSHTMQISFDQLPEYFRQLLKAVKHEGEFGERYFINVLAQNTPGLAARIELLITMRQSGYVVQNKRLCLPFMLASDSDFKEHLIGCFDKMRKEKEQLRRSVSVLEGQLQEERTRSRELEDKNRWLQKELEFSQGLLKSAENIQKHYESLLNQKHRGEIGGSVLVKIEDSLSGGDTASSLLASTLASQQMAPISSNSMSVDKDVRQDMEEGDIRSADGLGERVVRKSPIISINNDITATVLSLESGSGLSQLSISGNSNDNDLERKISTSVGGLPSQNISTIVSTMLIAPGLESTSPGDKKTLKGAAKRKASFHNYTMNQGQNANSSFLSNVTASITSSTTTVNSGLTNVTGDMVDEKQIAEQTNRPPPRKFAAAMAQVDNSQFLQQIRLEQEQQQKKVEMNDEADEAKRPRYSPTIITQDTAAVTTSPPPPRPPPSLSKIDQRGPETSAFTSVPRSPPCPTLPPRPFSQPTMVIAPPISQQSFAAPPPPPAPIPTAHAIQNAGHIASHFPAQLQSPWSFISSSPSLPVVSSLQIPVAAAAAAAFAGHHDFVGLGMSPYLLPTISSVTGGVVTTPMSSTLPTTSAFESMNGAYEESYNHMADNFARNITESSEVLNDHLAEEMNNDTWTAMIPKSEPSDYHEDHMSDNSRDGSALLAGCRNGPTTAAALMQRHLMSAVTMNENNIGSRNGSPIPSGAPSGSYSTSASPSLSTSSADGIDGVISYLKCLICERSFGQEGAAAHMVQHIRDPQRCTICTEMPPFQSKDELVKHMIGHCARAYACRYCGKENPRVHYLKIHVRSHTGEKPYTCLQCGRGFADASTWRRHERVHTGEKPYECTICGRRIARRDNVKIHMRSHMRSKVQMSCRTCGKVFAQPNHLVLHERMCSSGGIGTAVGLDLKPGSASSTSSADLSIVD